MKSTRHYDFAIIGTGAGGGTLAYALAPSGKRILLLERGGWLPRRSTIPMSAIPSASALGSPPLPGLSRTGAVPITIRATGAIRAAARPVPASMATGAIRSTRERATGTPTPMAGSALLRQEPTATCVR